MSILSIGEVFRYSRPYSPEIEYINDFKNHFYVTNLVNGTLALLEKGINQIAAVKANDGPRIPAVIIRSSPHKIGSETTPWQDVFDVDNGHIRYYGDNKNPGSKPELAPGNKILLKLFQTYNTEHERQFSVPLIFYKAVNRNNSSKGYIQFNGFGIIKGVELKTQYDRILDRTFSNYAFDFHVFSLNKDDENFNWNWINDRRNPKLTTSETLKLAPKSWEDWIKNGNKVLEKNRRRVSFLLVHSKQQQLPLPNSKEHNILKSLYNYYLNKKSRFEILASIVTSKILNSSGKHYIEGWITPSTSDGGADFYGRLDIGEGFGKAKFIVLGQAKCERVDVATGGNHVARTVARLKRGWLGVYVTTSYFSEAVQREIIEDEYPIMLINGKTLAEALLRIINEEGYFDLKQFLDKIDSEYSSKIKIRRPEELLFE